MIDDMLELNIFVRWKVLSDVLAEHTRMHSIRFRFLIIFIENEKFVIWNCVWSYWCILHMFIVLHGFLGFDFYLAETFCHSREKLHEIDRLWTCLFFFYFSSHSFEIIFCEIYKLLLKWTTSEPVLFQLSVMTMHIRCCNIYIYIT